MLGTVPAAARYYQVLQGSIYKVYTEVDLCPLTKAGVFEPNHQTILQQDYPDCEEDDHIEAPQQPHPDILEQAPSVTPVEDPPQIPKPTNDEKGPS